MYFCMYANVGKDHITCVETSRNVASSQTRRRATYTLQESGQTCLQTRAVRINHFTVRVLSRASYRILKYSTRIPEVATDEGRFKTNVVPYSALYYQSNNAVKRVKVMPESGICPSLFQSLTKQSRNLQNSHTRKFKVLMAGREGAE